MTLPRRIGGDDVRQILSYFVKKPMGASYAEAKQVLDAKYFDSFKIPALKTFGFLEEQDGRLKITDLGREVLRNNSQGGSVAFAELIRRIPPYASIVERAAHRTDKSFPAADVGSHWHEHFKNEVSGTEFTLNEQVLAFFQIAEAAALGHQVVGRKGSPTRFEFDAAALDAYTSDGMQALTPPPPPGMGVSAADAPPPVSEAQSPTGQGIFVGHGKNKKPLEQLRHILDQFKIPYKVAVEEPNLGRPIGEKVREIMQSCNCAILIFTADEELKDKDGNTVWRPSENVIHELGAASYLYDNRIVVLKEAAVVMPSNIRELGHIAFDKDQLEAKSMDVLRELIGFGIVKVST